MTMLATRERANGDSGGSQIMERVLLAGDLAKLTSDERLRYYTEVCGSLGLNPLTRPFEYITLNGKLTLYARKDCADQLRTVRKVSIAGLRAERIGDLYVVTARAETPDGRHDEEIGAVNVKNLGGDALANAMMKATTKAKRRVTLSLCGLGMLDETEIESIPAASKREFAESPEDAFRRLWATAIESRGATAQQADALLSGLLRQRKKFLEDLDDDARAALIEHAEAGKFDAYLHPPTKQAAPEPPPEQQLAEHDFAVTPDEKAALNEPDVSGADAEPPQEVADPKAEWKSFLQLCEVAAKAAGISDPEQFDRGMKRFIVGSGAKGKEHAIPQAKRDELLSAIKNRQGSFA